MIHWSGIFLFLILALLGLWVAYSFLNKNGLVVFILLAIALTFILPASQLFGYSILTNFVLMPLVYFSLIVMYEKYGESDAKKTFFVALATFGVLFIFSFLTLAYHDSNTNAIFNLTWQALGAPFMQIASFAIVGFLSQFIVDKFPIKKEYKYLRRAVIVSIAGAIDAFLITFIGFIGCSFVSLIAIFFIALVFEVGASFAVAFLRKFLNRQPVATSQNEQVVQSADTKQDVSQSEEVVEVEEENQDNN